MKLVVRLFVLTLACATALLIAPGASAKPRPPATDPCAGTNGPVCASQQYSYPYPDAADDTFDTCPITGEPCVHSAIHWGFYDGQCTSWVAYRVSQLDNVPFTNAYLGSNPSPVWGNAWQWGPHATTIAPNLVDGTPAKGAIAWWGITTAHPGGHVAVVESVKSARSIVISEMNWDNHNGFRLRSIDNKRGADWPTGFIHIERFTPAPSVFIGTPGYDAPAATLGGYTMTSFGPDPQDPIAVATVPGPTGALGLSPALNHAIVPTDWIFWSHGYTGDVYSTVLLDPSNPTLTITLPAGTRAYSFYAMPGRLAPPSVFAFTATANDGTSSGPVSVDGMLGARYFGFYSPAGGADLTSIMLSMADPTGTYSYAVGEFAIH